MKSCWILTHFEAHEDRDVYGVFLSKEKGEVFIQEWEKAVLKLRNSLPSYPDPEEPDPEAEKWIKVADARAAVIKKLKWPGDVKIYEHELGSAEGWLCLVETELFP